MRRYFIFLALLISFSLSAQDVLSTTSGFSAELGGQYASWSSSSNFISDISELDPNGYGYKLGVGYGFNEKFSLHVTYNELNLNLNDNWTKFSASGADIYGQITFGGTLQKFRPFLAAGISTKSMKIDPVTIDGIGEFELKNTGIGFYGAGGTNYHFLPNLAGSLQLGISTGSFSDNTLSGELLEIDETVDFSFVVLNLSFHYFFEY